MDWFDPSKLLRKERLKHARHHAVGEHPAVVVARREVPREAGDADEAVAVNKNLSKKVLKLFVTRAFR